MPILILAAPPVTSDNKSVNYDYQQIADIKPFLVKRFPAEETNFTFVTSENFLTKSTEVQTILPITPQEFYQSNIEFQNCASTFSNALFLTNSYFRSNGESFFSYFVNDLQKWANVSNTSLFPYSDNSVSSISKTTKIRNITSNFQLMNFSDYLYSLSSAYLYSDAKARLKGIQAGNYEHGKGSSNKGLNNPEETVRDILNLNNNSSSFIETMGPYFANGYPYSLLDFQTVKAHLMIGEDALKLWEMNKLQQYINQKTNIKNSPLIIQCDSASGNALSPNSGVSPYNFFDSLFNIQNGTSKASFKDKSDKDVTNIVPYPKKIIVTPPTSTDGFISQSQAKILNFLSLTPYIVFADTLGYNLSTDPTASTIPECQTVGAVYKCSPAGGIPSSTYTFTRQDDYVSASKRAPLNTANKSAQYTEYTIPPLS